jgi:pimeloyl-ACP methyl ester carboxylesterase
MTASSRPLPLAEAYSRAADPASGWRGSGAIRDYVAPERPDGTLMPTALVTRGEFDFVTEECLQEWDAALSRCRRRTFKGCSHHGLLEDAELYAETFENFWCEFD